MSLAIIARAGSAGGTLLGGGLWAAHAVIAVLFCFVGCTKRAPPMPELTAMMPWTGLTSSGFARFIALADLAGGLGLILPSLTRILPKLTIDAAIGCIVLQFCAVGLQASRGAFAVLPLNAVLIALSVFILWGRRGVRAPIPPRG